MRRSQSSRTGFTLIELLVVIAIIGLLIGILIPAVQKIRAKGPELRTANEISEISRAHQNFLSTYTVDYIPTCMWLCADYDATPALANSPSVQDSRQYYSKVWPKAFVAGNSGRSMFPNSMNQIGLDGNQLLLFLLGGIPPTDTQFTAEWYGNRTGFLNSPTNPFNYKTTKQGAPKDGYYPPGDGAQAQGPFYDFDPRRIDAGGHYHDPHWNFRDPTANANKNFYYYFSHKNGNDYNYFGRYAAPKDPAGTLPGMNVNGGYGDAMTGTLCNPFHTPVTAVGTVRFLNPDSFQLVSPGGKNGLPGPGGPFVSGQNEYVMHPTKMGFDDQSNFHRRLLGAGD